MTFDSPKDLTFGTDYIRRELAVSDWESTNQIPIKINFRDVLIFHNPAGDRFEITFARIDNKTQIMTRIRSAKEVEAEVARVREQANQKC